MQNPAAATAPAGAGRGGGIWKAVVPPKSMKGEFNSFDPIGVAAGARIKADCSLNWINPDDGKLYCFSSGTSLEYFLDMPHANLERARAEWRKMSARPQVARARSGLGAERVRHDASVPTLRVPGFLRGPKPLEVAGSAGPSTARIAPSANANRPWMDSALPRASRL